MGDPIVFWLLRGNDGVLALFQISFSWFFFMVFFTIEWILENEWTNKFG